MKWVWAAHSAQGGPEHCTEPRQPLFVSASVMQVGEVQAICWHVSEMGRAGL